MKKQLLSVVLLLISLTSFADDQNHLISIGTDGFGWSGASEVLKWKSSSNVKDHTVTTGKIAVDYAYLFQNGFMLGAAISSDTSKTEIKATSGSKVKSESSQAELGLILGYNFSSNYSHAWWVKAFIGSGTLNSKVTDQATPANNTDSKSTGGIFSLEVGKRFSLSSWGLTNVAYSPSLKYTSTSVDGDLKDSGLETTTAVALNLIKIDILF